MKSPQETKGGCQGLSEKSQGVVSPSRYLTPASPQQKQIYSMLTNEFLTVNQIAHRRKTSKQAVNKIIKKLKDKGLINDLLKPTKLGVAKNREWLQDSDNPPVFPMEKVIRLHGEIFWVRILRQSLEYHEKIGSDLSFKDVTVQCYAENLVLRSNLSFFGVDVADASRQSADFLSYFLPLLERKLSILLLQPKIANIKRVRSHYAHIDDEFSKDVQEKGERISFKTTDDGKVWLLADNSHGLHELETIHPETAESDMDAVVMPFMNDLRDFQRSEGFVPKPSEMWRGLAQNQAAMNDFRDKGLVPLTEQIRLHLSVMQEIKQGVRDLSSAVNAIKINPLDSLKLRIKSLDDVFCEKDAIFGLSDVQRADFSEWLLRKFGGLS